MAEISVDELIQSLNEFTKEENIDLDTIKPKISKLLKTHRPIKLTEYEYGISSDLSTTKDCRLIIREKDDRSKVRQYLKHQNHWNCSNRKRSNKCIAIPLKIIYGTNIN
uniref:Uncharacterized protein n=1 Tax=Panagrolaimus davidi TaxID=227884 RepID=A0A914P8H2_9BILA